MIDKADLEKILTIIAIINAIANIISAIGWVRKKLRTIFKPGKHERK